jgi:ABC-2 type transport system permease protein
MILGFFGQITDLPRWVHNVSPFEHIAGLTLAELTWAPLIVLTVIAAAVAALGLYGLRKRDIEGN